MAVETFNCPQCQVKLRRSAQLQPGARVQCPRCSTQFSVPPVEEAVPPPAPVGPAIGAEAGERERDDLVATGPRAGEDRLSTGYDPGKGPYGGTEGGEDYPSLRSSEPDLLSHEYTIDLNVWLAYAREHWGAILGPAVGYQVLLIIIGQVLGLIPLPFGLVAQLFVMPPLNAGLTIVCLAQLKGKRWEFGDFFGGFGFYSQTLGLTLLSGLLAVGFLGVPAGGLFALALTVSNGGAAPPVEQVLGLTGALAVLLVPYLYLSLRLNFFALALILDRNLGAIEAMKGSWKLTEGHFWGLLGTSIVLAGIYLGGFALCCVGALFAVPFIALVQTAGYLLVAGTQRPVSGQGLAGSTFDHREPDQ